MASQVACPCVVVHAILVCRCACICLSGEGCLGHVNRHVSLFLATGTDALFMQISGTPRVQSFGQYLLCYFYTESICIFRPGHIRIDTQVSVKIGPHAALSTVGDLVAW